MALLSLYLVLCCYENIFNKHNVDYYILYVRTYMHTYVHTYIHTHTYIVTDENY